MPINAFDTPNPLTAAVIKAAQAATPPRIAAGRYISGGGAWKHLTQAEVDLCKATGFGLFLIDEGTGNMAQFARGEAGGAQDGNKAAAAAQALGVPPGTPIFVGVDYGAGQESIGIIQSYMKGYETTCAPYVAGTYADGLIASAVPTDVGDFVPGASGWPGTPAYLKSGKVSLIQHPPIQMFGIDIDPVEVVDYSVLWFPGGSSKIIVVQPPPPTQPGAPVDTSTQFPPLTNPMQPPANPTSPVSVLPDLKAAQAELGVVPDGIWGPHTAAAFAQHYGG